MFKRTMRYAADEEKTRPIKSFRANNYCINWRLFTSQGRTPRRGQHACALHASATTTSYSARRGAHTNKRIPTLDVETVISNT